MKIDYTMVKEEIICESFKETKSTFKFKGKPCMLVTREFKQGCEIVYGKQETGEIFIDWLPYVPKTEEELELLLIYDSEPMPGCF